MKTVTTIQGDMWDKISLRVYGSERYMDRLIEANIDHREKFIFPSGVVLNCPDIDLEEDLVNESLPPWKL